MRWYKFSMVLAIGLLLELIVAAFSCLLIKENGEWLASLILPYFAPRSLVFYGALAETIYLSSAVSLACYAENKRDIPKGILLTASEGVAEIVTLLFFFKFTYEITSFFLATLTMLLSLFVTASFLARKSTAGVARIPAFIAHLYFWMVIYCILTLNFL